MENAGSAYGSTRHPLQLVALLCVFESPRIPSFESDIGVVRISRLLFMHLGGRS